MHNFRPLIKNNGKPDCNDPAPRDARKREIGFGDILYILLHWCEVRRVCPFVVGQDLLSYPTIIHRTGTPVAAKKTSSVETLAQGLHDEEDNDHARADAAEAGPESLHRQHIRRSRGQ